jgi:hypothetical protein
MMQWLHWECGHVVSLRHKKRPTCPARPRHGLSSLTPSLPYNPSQHCLLRTFHCTPPLQEDIEELPAPRMFWPREIWGQYASELEDFKDKHTRAAAVQCLNNMVGRHSSGGVVDSPAFRFSDNTGWCLGGS